MNTNHKKMDAVEFHDSIVEIFNNNYKKKQSFIERYIIWTHILDKYIPSKNKNVKILDAGCGTGVLSFYLAEKGFEVTGIDGSKKMIEFCKLKLKESLIENLMFKKREMPLHLNNDELSTYEVVISSSVLEYIPNIKESVVSFKNILKRNGLFIVSLPNKRSIYRILEKLVFNIIGKPEYFKYIFNVYSLNEFKIMLEKEGFEILESKYYSKKNFLVYKIIGKILPKKFTDNLFVVVCKKK